MVEMAAEMTEGIQMALPTNSKKYISGLTLIEILIGIVISSIIMGAMYTTYTVVDQSYSQVTNKAKISRAGRDIVEMLIRDIRMAGFKYVLGVNTLTITFKTPQRLLLENSSATIVVFLYEGVLIVVHFLSFILLLWGFWTETLQSKLK